MLKILPGSIWICAIGISLTLFAWSVRAESTTDPATDANVPNPTLAKMLDRLRKLFKTYQKRHSKIRQAKIDERDKRA